MSGTYRSTNGTRYATRNPGCIRSMQFIQSEIMRDSILLLILICTLALWPSTAQLQPTKNSCSSCELAQQALNDLKHVEVGSTRRELEKYFAPAGGMVFRNHTDYVSKKCDYFKIQVDFKLDPAVERDLSPDDTISNVSGIFLAYPSRD